MTRINVVPVTELTDKHLLAEYRELPRVFELAWKWDIKCRAGKHAEDIPDEYVLGSGHVRFFYNKLLFCFNRQFDLYGECLRRGFKVQYNPEKSRADFMKAPRRLFNDYTPTRHALRINRERIATRLSEAAERRTAKR
jgi:deoxyribonuclease (pyrimidine dimer)